MKLPRTTKWPDLFFSLIHVIPLTFVENIAWVQPTAAPKGFVPWNICYLGKVLLAGRFGKNSMSLEGKCCLEIDNSECNVKNSCYVLFVRNRFALLPLFHWRIEFCPMTTPQQASNEVAGCRCTLLAGNSSISLAGIEELINFSQQSPKMNKMALESFIHALLLFLCLFLKISRWVPWA